MADIAGISKEYQLQSLTEKEVDPDPFSQFNKWWEEAIKSVVPEINAMTLATASAAGVPSARTVLLKGVTEDGFIFFTNYNSQKGKELAQNPNACLVFFWAPLERQVIIEGVAEKISDVESDAYFNSRPLESRIGAWSSPQSTVINSRDIIEDNVAQFSKQFADGNIPRPLNWGGYLVKPKKIEFWQGRAGQAACTTVYNIRYKRMDFGKLNGWPHNGNNAIEFRN